jgi:hypothetical protein
MTIDEQIADLEFAMKKIDGHTLFDNIGNRVYGACGLFLVGLPVYFSPPSAMPLLLPIAVPFAIEMIGDIATGKHHFISYRLLKIHPKYELEKLRDEQETFSQNL